jgi:hypothetical protein
LALAEVEWQAIEKRGLIVRCLGTTYSLGCSSVLVRGL